MYPENFRYTKEHEWVLVEGDTCTIGITDHAQQELGDIVYVDLPKPANHVEQGKSLGLGGVGEGRLGYLFAGDRRSDGDQRNAGRRAGNVEQRPARRGWLVKLRLSAPAEAAGADDRRGLPKIHGGGKVGCAIFRSQIPNAARC